MTITEVFKIAHNRIELRFSNNNYWCQFDHTDKAFKLAVDEDYQGAEVLAIYAEEYSIGDAVLILTVAVDQDQYYSYLEEKQRGQGSVVATNAGSTYVVKFTTYSHEARTLDPGDIGYHTDSGWTLKGEVHTDYYSWVNYFEATKGDDWVRGDFEQEVTASSERAYLDFIKHFQVQEWDYWDI